MNTVQFTDKELAPLRRCIEAHELETRRGYTSHRYAVNCGTVVYSRNVGSSNIYLTTCKHWNTVNTNVDRNAPIYGAIILSDNSVIGDQEAIDIIAEAVGR